MVWRPCASAVSEALQADSGARLVRAPRPAEEGEGGGAWRWCERELIACPDFRAAWNTNSDRIASLNTHYRNEFVRPVRDPGRIAHPRQQAWASWRPFDGAWLSALHGERRPGLALLRPSRAGITLRFSVGGPTVKQTFLGLFRCRTRSARPTCARTRGRRWLARAHWPGGG